MIRLETLISGDDDQIVLRPRSLSEAASEAQIYALTEPPRVYRRVICSIITRPYQVCSGLHRTPPLLLLAGCIRWGREVGGC